MIGKKKRIKGISIFVVILFVLTVFLPVFSNAKIINKETEKTVVINNDNRDFSITIHRIKQIDEIDPIPHTPEGEWDLRMYVNGVKKTLDCSGNDITLDKTIIWEKVIPSDYEEVEIKMELLEKDSGWPDMHDIADISAKRDLNYENGDYDDTDNFNGHRPAVFVRNYDLVNKRWFPTDNNNDYLRVSDQTILEWYITSGNYDGSTTVDENDVSIYFNVSLENIPPYPPEKPSGPSEGWIDTPYEFSTKGFDIDGDYIKFGWDWNDDDIIDDFTTYYDSWQTARITKSFSDPRIYYVKVVAVDEKGLTSEWSETLKVEINGPYGKTGFEVEDWDLGNVYSSYYDHHETQEILSIMRSGGNVIAALSTLISAIATACGVPIDYTAAFAVASGILRLGCEVINLMDRGMGIYIRVYTIGTDDLDLPVIEYIWSQSLSEDAWEPPEGNKAPNKPLIPSGETKVKQNEQYTYEFSVIDPDNDNVKMLIDWGDGNYSDTETIGSKEEISLSHKWSKKGCYYIRVKALDDYCHESVWSDPLMINVHEKSKQRIFSDFINILQNFMNQKNRLIFRGALG